MTPGRKLQIGKLSLWIEDGTPRANSPLKEALSLVRGWMSHAELWITAVEEMSKEELTPGEERRLDLMIRKNRRLDLKSGITPEQARERYSRQIRAGRGQDLSDF